MQAVRVGDVTLNYRWARATRDQGNIVFINSLGTDLRIWDETCAALSGRHSILTYDKRGHGLSDLGAKPYTIDHHVDDLEGLMDYLGLGQSIICGLSVGGQIALGLASRRPDLVSKLILCDTASKIGTTSSWNDRIALVNSSGMSSVTDFVLERWFTPTFRREQNSMFALARNMLLRQPAAGYAATCAAIRDADLSSIAARLQVPVLCIVGAEDQATPPELVQSMAHLIPNSKIQIIERCGHIPCLECSEVLTQLICTFINGESGDKHD